jgi:hypothetical protein
MKTLEGHIKALLAFLCVDGEVYSRSHLKKETPLSEFVLSYVTNNKYTTPSVLQIITQKLYKFSMIFCAGNLYDKKN